MYLYGNGNDEGQHVEQPRLLLEDVLVVDHQEEGDAHCQQHRVAHNVWQLAGNVKGGAVLVEKCLFHFVALRRKIGPKQDCSK